MYIGDIYQANPDANRKDFKFFEKSSTEESCLMCGVLLLCQSKAFNLVSIECSLRQFT